MYFIIAALLVLLLLARAGKKCPLALRALGVK